MASLRLPGLICNVWSKVAQAGLAYPVWIWLSSLLLWLSHLSLDVRSETCRSMLGCGLTLDVWSEIVGFRTELENPASRGPYILTASCPSADFGRRLKASALTQPTFYISNIFLSSSLNDSTNLRIEFRTWILYFILLTPLSGAAWGPFLFMYAESPVKLPSVGQAAYIEL